MSTRILTKEEIPNISKVKKKFDVFRAIKIESGDFKIVEFFNTDGVFRGFGRDTKAAYKKAKRALKKYYN